MRPALKYALLGCALCALLAGALAGGAFALGYLTVGKPSPEIETVKTDARKFLDQAAAGETDAAFAHFSPTFKEKLPREKLADMVEKDHDFFEVTDARFDHSSIHNEIYTIRGSVTGRTGKRHQALFRYQRVDGAFKLVAFTIGDEPIGDRD